MFCNCAKFVGNNSCVYFCMCGDPSVYGFLNKVISLSCVVYVNVLDCVWTDIDCVWMRLAIGYV